MDTAPTTIGPTGSADTDDAIGALHLLRTRGGATRDEVAERAGTAVVEALVTDELVSAAGPRLRLTAAGRAEHERALAHELDEVDGRDALADGYRRFLPHNAEVIQLCTDWQLRSVDGTPVINDHSDAGYDAAIVERLTTVEVEAGGLLDEMGDVLPRYRGYRAELATAADRVRSGNSDFLTNPRVRCYHTVWFELHEDLLATLGIAREDEGAATGTAGP